MEKAKGTYQRQVLEYIREHGSITSREAFEHIGVTRIGTVIFELRKKGYPILTIMIDDEKNGVAFKYGRYILKESEGEK